MREVRKRGAFRGRCGLREPSTLRAAGRGLGQGVPAGLSPPPLRPYTPRRDVNPSPETWTSGRNAGFAASPQTRSGKGSGAPRTFALGVIDLNRTLGAA